VLLLCSINNLLRPLGLWPEIVAQKVLVNRGTVPTADANHLFRLAVTRIHEDRKVGEVLPASDEFLGPALPERVFQQASPSLESFS
jgi:hypothetical protein